LMQKNLTCRNIGEAQKNMFSFTVIMVIVNFLFLTLGALLYLYCAEKGIAIPKRTDDLYPMLAFSHFGLVAGICFLLGIIASSYASSDSALTALTTSFCIDFLNFHKKDEATKSRQKTLTHIGFSVLFLVIILAFKAFNSSDVITSVLRMASYTYGPLLGLFAFGIFSNRTVLDRWYTVPIVCVLSPFITLLITSNSETWFNGYKFSFETLLVNGLITFIGLLIVSKPGKVNESAAISV